MPPSRSILVLRLSAFGDVLHTMPAVASLRASLPPQTRLGWVVEKPLEELVRLVAPVDEVFVASTRSWRRAPMSATSRGEVGFLRRSLREFAAGQTAIDFQGLVKSSVVGIIAGASVRYGFDSSAVRERLSLLMTNRKIRVEPRHVVEMNLQLAAAAGALEPPPALDFSRFEDDPSGRIERCVNARTVVLNPGAGHRAKRWSLEKFASLADRLTAELQLEPLVIWGPGEESDGESIAARSSATLAPPTTLRELTFLLRRCRLMVSGDTGPLHLAAALGTEVVGLYGPTDPSRNGPYGQLDRCVSRWETTRSLETISVDEVMKMAASSPDKVSSE